MVNEFAKRAQQQQDDRWAMGDAYRKQQISQFEATGKQIQQALAAPANPYTGKPWTEEEKGKAQASLAHITAHVKNLYDPNFDPSKGFGGESILHKLTDKFHMTKAPDTKAAGQEMATAQGDLQQYATVPPANPELQKVKQIEAVLGHPMSDEQKNMLFKIEPKETPTKFQPQLTTTKDAEGKEHYWRVPLETGGTPEEVDFKGQNVSPKSSSAPKVGTLGEFLIEAYGPHPTAQQTLEGRRLFAQAAASTTVGEHIALVPQKDGSTKAFSVTTTNTKSFPGATLPVADSKAPGQQQKDISNIQAKHRGAGVRDTGVTVGGRENSVDRGLSKDYTETNTAYEAAKDRQDTMHQNLQNALQGDQQAMLSLVANHIGMTLGAQKGARINQAVWNEAVSSAPWMAKVSAKFDSRGVLSGVTLAPEQMEQMVRLADEKVQTLKDHAGRAKAKLPGAQQGPSDDEILDKINKIKLPGKP